VRRAKTILAEIESRCDLELEHARVAEVVLSATLTQLPRLEAIGLGECFRVARRYWNDETTEAELSLAREVAWKSIRDRSVIFNDREVNLVRLLICALYGKHEDLSTDQDGPLYTVMRFALGAGVEELALVNALSSQFATELESNAR
jgi:hypothetical protein